MSVRKSRETDNSDAVSKESNNADIKHPVHKLMVEWRIIIYSNNIITIEKWLVNTKSASRYGSKYNW